MHGCALEQTGGVLVRRRSSGTVTCQVRSRLRNIGDQMYHRRVRHEGLLGFLDFLHQERDGHEGSCGPIVVFVRFVSWTDRRRAVGCGVAQSAALLSGLRCGREVYLAC